MQALQRKNAMCVSGAAGQLPIQVTMSGRRNIAAHRVRVHCARVQVQEMLR